LQIAVHEYVNEGDSAKPFYNLVTQFRIGNELYQRLTGKRKIQQCKLECVKNITEFIKNNPSASEKKLAEVVQSEVALFAAKIQ